jgi:hypothetical protein
MWALQELGVELQLITAGLLDKFRGGILVGFEFSGAHLCDDKLGGGFLDLPVPVAFVVVGEEGVVMVRDVSVLLNYLAEPIEKVVNAPSDPGSEAF